MSDEITFQERLEQAHTFPCAYTFKLIGEGTDAFRERIEAITREHAPQGRHQLTHRGTSSGRHQSVTVVLTVPDSNTVLALYEAYRDLEGLKVML